MKSKPKFEPSKLIEKYRWPIGTALLAVVLVLGGYLLWRDNFQRPKQEVSNNYQSQISQLKKRVSDLEKSKSSGQVAGAVATKSVQPTSGKININTATAAELDSLPGIGPVYAGRIIEYRTAKGGFKTPDEIMNIKGIGQKTYDKFKDKISI